MICRFRLLNFSLQLFTRIISLHSVSVRVRSCLALKSPLWETNHYLNISLHGILLLFYIFSGNLFPLLYPRFNQEQHRGHVLHGHTNKSQSKWPRQIVLLPIRHEVSTISLSSEDDERYCSTHSCYHQISSDPPQHLHSATTTTVDDVDMNIILTLPVIFINAEQIHQSQSNSNQHSNEAKCEEELSGHKKCWKRKIFDFVQKFLK